MRYVLFPFLFIAFSASSASAQDALKVDLVPKAQKGQGHPELVVKAQARLDQVVLKLKRSTDGKTKTLSSGPIDAGRSHRFALPMDRVGSVRFTGTLEVKVGNGQSGSMPIDVEAELLAPLELTIEKADVDIPKKTIRLSASRPLKKVQVTLMSDLGTPLGTTEVDVTEDGGKYTIKFDRKAGTIMRMAVMGYDSDGFFGGVDLFPWQVDIPHEEVHFRSGKADIDKPELVKLEESYTQITKAVNKYGKLANVRLFIAGHTDTVGDVGSNRALSNRRAQAIGRWFKKRGIHIPILYAGFGEDVLSVKTPDETDEVRNRRAEYIVAVDKPSISGRATSWRPL